MKVEVGMAATRNAVTDSDPCTVISVNKTGKTITLQDDLYTVTSGSEHDGSAKYEYKPNPKGAKSIASFRKDGYFKLRGSCKGYGLVNLGFRRRYRDPSF